MKTFSLRTLLGGLTMGAIAATAFAGDKIGQEVVINDIKKRVSGDLGYARNTADTVQYIGCNMGGPAVTCVARNSAGLVRSCSTTDPDYVSILRALNGDSHLIFGWDAVGNCINLAVWIDSRLAPKQ